MIGQTIGESIAGGIAGNGSGDGGSIFDAIGDGLNAVGDFLGFDGDFGYQGPEGRSLSLAGLGDSIEDVGASIFGSDAPTEADLVFWAPPGGDLTGFLNDSVYRTGEDDALLWLTQGGGSGGSRTGIGGNRPPMDSLTQIFPLTPNTPAGAVLAPIDSFLGLSAPVPSENLTPAELGRSAGAARPAGGVKRCVPWVRLAA